MKRLTIGRAARVAGVTVETIRFYERRGLIAQPLRPVAGCGGAADASVRPNRAKAKAARCCTSGCGAVANTCKRQ